MASFWESAATHVGYATGAVIFGPQAAIIRRERRVLRGAFHGWLDEMDAERRVSPSKGIARRSGSLRGAEPIPFEAVLDPMSKRARVDVAMALGRDVTAEMTKVGARVRLGGTTLDADTAHELAREVEASELRRLESFILDLRKDRLVVDLPAPREAESWRAIEKALVVLAESWSRRFSSYR
jgi:hypothetical protein